MMNLGESNLFLGFMARQYELDSLASQIASEYKRGNTTFLTRVCFDLSESDIRYIEDRVEKILK